MKKTKNQLLGVTVDFTKNVWNFLFSGAWQDPFTHLVVFIDGIKDDQRRVPGDLKLGVGYRRSVVHHDHDVFRLGTHRGHIHWPAGPRTNMHVKIRRLTTQSYSPQPNIYTSA